MKIAALVIVLAGFAMPALAIPKPFNKIDKAAVALFDASAKKYAAARTISTTFLVNQQGGANKAYIHVRRPGDYHLQNGDGSTQLLYTGNYEWETNSSGFYWRSFPAEDWEKDAYFSDDPMIDWVFALLSRKYPLKVLMEQGGAEIESKHLAVSLLKPRKIRGIPCVGFCAQQWNHDLRLRFLEYRQEDVWLRADNQTLWAVHGMDILQEDGAGDKNERKTPIYSDFLDTRFDLPLKDDVFVYRLPKGQHDWVKDTATPFWSPDLHLNEAAPRLMTCDEEDFYEPNVARTTPLVVWIGLRNNEKESLADVERLANQWGGPKCEVRAVLLGGQVQWTHNGGQRNDEKHNLTIKFEGDFNHSCVVQALGLKKVPFLLVIDREGKVAALNPDEKKLGEILPKLMESGEK